MSQLVLPGRQTIIDYKNMPVTDQAAILGTFSDEELQRWLRLWRARVILSDRNIARGRDRLIEFVKICWHELEPGAFVANWHHELVCEYLEYQFHHPLEFNKLLINVQPRVLKSMICSVFFPCWVWLHRPGERFLCLSYAGQLANNHNFARRMLMLSDTYRQLSADRPIHLLLGKNRISEFQNTEFGEMISRGMDGAVTGVGGTWLMSDDPNNPETVESEVQREGNVAKVKAYFTTRKSDPDAPITMIQQRTHSADASGWWLDEYGDEIIKLILPSRAHEDQILYFPMSKVRKRRSAGKLLHEERFNEKHEREAKKLGTQIYNARYLQSPIPPGGGLIKSRDFPRYKTFPTGIQLWIVSWDTAQEKEETSAFWSGILAGVKQGRLYIKQVYTEHHQYPDGERALVSLAQKWGLRNLPHIMKIERKSTGATLIQRLATEKEFRHLRLKVVGEDPCHDKITRMCVEVPTIEAGYVYLPETAPWLPEFEGEITKFPEGLMDPVDALSQLLKYFRIGGWKRG